MHDGKAEKIRLIGIDCPEDGQAFGRVATQFVSNAVFNQTVVVQVYRQDEYQRTLAEVLLPDGRSLNRELIKTGLAWWFFKYSNDRSLGYLEVEAKAAKLGLWEDGSPIPPWVFRDTVKRSLPQPSFPQTLSKAGESPIQSSPVDGPILGNRRSKKYHRPGCRNYDDIAEKNQIAFDNAVEAEKAGYTLAGNCP